MSDQVKDEQLSPRSSLYAPPPLPPLLPPSPEPLDEHDGEDIPVDTNVAAEQDKSVQTTIPSKTIQLDKAPGTTTETPTTTTTCTLSPTSTEPSAATPTLTTSATTTDAASTTDTPTTTATLNASPTVHPEIPKLPEFVLLPPESIRPIAPSKLKLPNDEPARFTPGKKGMSSTAKRLAELASLQSSIKEIKKPDVKEETDMEDIPTTVENTPTNTDNDTTKTPARPKRPIEPIFYDLGPSPSADSALRERVVQERQKQLTRLLRFSAPTGEDEDVSLTRITETTVLGARRASIRRGFATGFDTSTPEEEQKRLARARRFGPPESHPFYKPDEDVQARLARAERFGQEAIAAASEANQNSLPPVKTLETRRTPEEDEKPRMTVIHLFGVDRLSTADVMKYFSPYGPSWCEWLNDSSCNIAFEDAYTMRRALRGMSVGSDPSYDPDAMDEGEIDSLDKKEATEEKNENNGEDGKLDMDVSNDETPTDDLVWRKMKPFDRKGRTTPLWGRMATAKDVRPERPNPNSKWSRTVRRQHILSNVEEDGYTFFTVKKAQGKRPFSVLKDNHSIQKSSHAKKAGKTGEKMDEE